MARKINTLKESIIKHVSNAKDSVNQMASNVQTRFSEVKQCNGFSVELGLKDKEGKDIHVRVTCTQAEKDKDMDKMDCELESGKTLNKSYYTARPKQITNLCDDDQRKPGALKPNRIGPVFAAAVFRAMRKAHDQMMSDDDVSESYSVVLYVKGTSEITFNLNILGINDTMPAQQIEVNKKMKSTNQHEKFYEIDAKGLAIFEKQIAEKYTVTLTLKGDETAQTIYHIIDRGLRDLDLPSTGFLDLNDIADIILENPNPNPNPAIRAAVMTGPAIWSKTSVQLKAYLVNKSISVAKVGAIAGAATTAALGLLAANKLLPRDR